MADDPNRDILPIREGSCPDTCRSSLDPRERHTVSKLDRYELEDKYLRLYEETHNLKKLTNRQDDKIKRLATKLMRVTTNPRACTVALDVFEDKNKIIALEIENSKLKDKITVLRNQLLSHTISGRSTSRTVNLQVRPSSGHITCRSENSRIKVPSCHCIVATKNNDSNTKNNLDKIEELEIQKREMSNRIDQLEEELLASTAVKQREKVAENVEYIKVWRQMMQLNDKLKVTEHEKELLSIEINDLKRKLEEKTKSDEEITTKHLMEKKLTAEIDEHIMKVKDCQLTLREKDEQIKDLANEVKILQQHNNELIELTSKFGEVELENKQLKKKITEQLNDQESLKSAFNAEQANIVSLQASNEQLFGKLQELQKTIDNLTVQLTFFQSQTASQEKQNASKATQTSTKQNDMKIPNTFNKQKPHETFEKKLQQDIVSKSEKCTACGEKDLLPERATPAKRQNIKQIDTSVQTEDNLARNEQKIGGKEQDVMTQTSLKEYSKQERPQIVMQGVGPDTMTNEALTSEKMLKLLDQVQINVPLNAARFSEKNMIGGVGYNSILEQNQRHSGSQTLVQATQGRPVNQPAQQEQGNDNSNPTIPQFLNKQLADPNNILSLLFTILEEYTVKPLKSDDVTLYRPASPIKYHVSKDMNNNNIEATSHDPLRTGSRKRKYYSCFHNKSRQEKPKNRTSFGVKKNNRTSKVGDNNKCTCNNAMRCKADLDCDQSCCGTVKSASIIGPCTVETHRSRSTINMNCNTIQDFVSKNFGTTHIPRQLQDEADQFWSWEKQVSIQNKNDVSSVDEPLQEYIKQLNKCRELVTSATGIPDQTRTRLNVHKESKPEVQKVKSCCNLTEHVDFSATMTDSFPLMIAEGQGLVELHIVSLQLSTSTKQILCDEKDFSNLSMFVSLDIWNQETAFTPTLKCPKLNFNSSFVYRIADLVSFFNYVLLEFVIFRVNVFHEDNNSYEVARGKLCIKDILDYPQNKLHYIAPVNSVISCSAGMNFGQLSLWVRLSCDIEKVTTFKKKRGIYTTPSDEKLPKAVASSKIAATSKPKTDLVVMKSEDSEEEFPAIIREKSQQIFPRDFTVTDESKQIPSPIVVYPDANSEDMPQTVPQSIQKTTYLTVVKESDEEEEKVESEDTFLSDRQSLFTGTKEWSNSMDVNTDKRKSNSPTELQDKTEDPKKHYIKGANSSRLEFNALINKNPGEITKVGSADSMSEVTDVILEKHWDEYKERSLLTFRDPKPQTVKMSSNVDLLNGNQLNEDTIIIEIVDMILYPTSSLMQNPEYQLLYIEYCFLGYCGEDMETVSKRKPVLPNQMLTYNFRKKFQVDTVNHPLQNNILCAMLDDTSNPNIKFIVVCEPLPKETDTKECVEVGFATFNLREFALANPVKLISLPIFDMEQVEQIGVLKICVLGHATIRQRLAKPESTDL